MRGEEWGKWREGEWNGVYLGKRSEVKGKCRGKDAGFVRLVSNYGKGYKGS